ncbi:hypothetical protein TrispH2_010167 [Trichoplax sp. H2]|nr:hypothetical protein TrispH2_010167 [Trichoplax sp. H2]|eukprot:RDD38953.1 hypothetical protein TrispH2_010167 [Trichoplax sp. H2]
MANGSHFSYSAQPLLHADFKFLIPILTTVCIASMFFNSFNLMVISRKLSLRNIQNSFLTCLNITDLCTGSLAIPCLIVALWYQNGDAICQVQGFIASFCNGMALLLSTTIALDRCYAVVFPYHYLANSSIRRYAIIITSCCI